MLEIIRALRFPVEPRSSSNRSDSKAAEGLAQRLDPQLIAHGSSRVRCQLYLILFDPRGRPRYNERLLAAC